VNFTSNLTLKYDNWLNIGGRIFGPLGILLLLIAHLLVVSMFVCSPFTLCFTMIAFVCHVFHAIKGLGLLTYLGLLRCFRTHRVDDIALLPAQSTTQLLPTQSSNRLPTHSGPVISVNPWVAQHIQLNPNIIEFCRILPRL